MPRIEAPYGAQPDQLAQAEKASQWHPELFVLSGLGATEELSHIHLLNAHRQQSQIPPATLWRMRREDLAFIAGHTGDAYSDSQVREKIVANASRARAELNRRDQLSIGVLAASIGAIAGLIAATL